MIDSQTVEAILDWAEERIAYNHNKEDFRACLAIAQEFDEWFNTQQGDSYHIHFYPDSNHD